MEKEIAKLVQRNLDFFNLNRIAERHLGLSLVQYHLLVILRDMPGCSPQKLASAAGMHPSTLTQSLRRYWDEFQLRMHPSTLTQSLRRLQKKRAVFITEDSKDSRKKLLTLTRKGNDLIESFSSGIFNLLDGKYYTDLLSIVQSKKS